MKDTFCYNNINEDKATNDQIEFIRKLTKYSDENSKVIYILGKPLGDKKYEYDYDKAFLILIPKYRLMFVNFSKNEKDKFENYTEDFKEDLGYISDKYDYKEILGRPRLWKDHFFSNIEYEDIKNIEIEDFIDNYKIESDSDIRKGELLISLLTGSINEAARIGEEIPKNTLEQIKRKIVLFDADQTRFIYEEPNQKRITIQGLAGTGKTELLLHKLKDLYLRNSDSKIVFTCFNKILADNLRSRIQEFFDFMKVEEQIKWNERLWTIGSWGTKFDKDSGVYRYICDYYNIQFNTYSYQNSFDKVCQEALKEIIVLELLGEFEPCFDYVLIDESQDFPESFFELCEKVTKTTVYIAGDIFQNIFDHDIVNKIEPNFLLNKCYRTDPKTLMFAHGIGMGLFDEKPIRWLTDKEWEVCGYNLRRENGECILSRAPLRRFEDIDTKESVRIVQSEEEGYEDNILKIVQEIRNNNPTVKPDDIAIIFLENTNENYQLADKLQYWIKEKFGWETNKGYETKEKTKNCLFISNRNNVKGLEFPFVICVVRTPLLQDLQIRNSLYMMLTRSFLTSYFIIPDTDQNIEKYQKELSKINQTGLLRIKEPSDQEKLQLRRTIISYNKINKSTRDIVDEILEQLKTPPDKKKKLQEIVKVMTKEGQNYSEEYIKEVILQNYNLM